MSNYQIASWWGFLSVTASVAARLTGLIFVAVSINLSRILEFPGLAERAAESILQMFGPVIVSMLALFPDQSSLELGVELAIAGLVLWTFQTRHLCRSFSTQERRRPIISIVVSQLATLLFLISGVSLAIGRFGGLAWLGTGAMVSIAGGVSSAWVSLVEILR
jgi:hypothetical protein